MIRKKHTHSLLYPVLFLLALLFLLVSCESGMEEGKTGLSEGKDGKLYLTLPDDDTTQTIPVSRMDAADASGYAVVRSENDEGSVPALQIIYKGMKEMIPDVSVMTDWVKRGQEIPVGTKEILVGETNRPESPDIGSLRYDDYMIRYENGRFVVCGGSYAATEKAAELFMEYFAEPETHTLLIPEGTGFVHAGRYPCDSVSVNGVSLGDFSVISEFTANEETLASVGNFFLNMTGYSPAKEPAHTVTIRKTENTELCTITGDSSGNILLSAGKEADADLAVRYFLYEIRKACPVDPEKTGQKMEMTFSGTLTLQKEEILAMEPTKLYVAPDGNDENPGTEEAPLATMNGAKLHVREELRSGLAPVTVYFRGGDYFFTEPVVFDGSDSGTAAAPVTYCAYPGETVSFIGGVKIDKALVKKAESTDILDRVPDADVRGKLMQIDLSSVIEKIPDIYSFGHSDNDAKRPLEIYVNGSALKRSCWPNNIPGSAYLRTSKKDIRVNADGSKTIFYDDETAAHVNTWSEKSLSDLYMLGFLAYDWTNEVYDASGIDRDENSITLKGGLNKYFESIAPDRRFSFFNLPEEIDLPNESYIDRDARIVYFLPTEDFSADSVYLAMLNDTMLKFNGTAHIRMENINFSYMRANAISAENTDDFTLSGCTISHTSAKAALFTESRNVRITGCEVFDTANGGIDISGGSRETLTSSGSVIENCVIHDINRDGSTYGPGISASAVGLVIRNNHLYNAIHEMIAIGTNDVVIENNEIDHCVTECSDMGAIYYGRNPSIMGTVIRNNYFHDMGNDYGGTGQFSIYIDDGSTGADIYGNLFLRAAGAGSEGQAAIMHHGTQFSHIHDNLFVDTAIGLRYAHWTTNNSHSVQDNWYLWLYDRWRNDGNSVIEKCRSVDFDSAVWHEKYDSTVWGQLYAYINTDLIAEYEALSDADLAKLARERGPYESNEIDNNVYINVPVLRSEGTCNMHDNYSSDDTSVFRDYAGGDYSLTEEGLAKIKEAAPSFEAPDLSKTGVGKQG